MKTRIALMLMVCGMASLGIVPVSEADILSALMANPPQAPHVDEQGPAARPANKPVLQESRVAYQEPRPQSRTVLITPQRAQSPRPRVAAQTMRAAEIQPQANVSLRPTTRQALASAVRPASAPNVAKSVPVAKRQTSAVRVGKSNPRIQARQTQPLLASAYNTQPAQRAYAPRYPQQPTYAAAAPNSYQGYQYQGWGSTNPAACAPGRA